MSKNKIIALTGTAAAGKDLMYELLAERIPCKRVALADELKHEMRPFILDKFNVDLLNCTRIDKDRVRPLLVEYARIKRQETNGRYFIDKITDYIKDTSINCPVIITDLRFCIYDRDELYWLKSELEGGLVHIKKHELVNGAKIYTESPIADERLNDPILEKNADFHIDWPEFGSSDEEVLKSSCYVDKLMLKFAL